MSDCYEEGDYLQWDIDIQRCTMKLHSNTFDDKQCLLNISSIPQYPLGKWFVPESFLKNELEKLPNVFICNPPKTWGKSPQKFLSRFHEEPSLVVPLRNLLPPPDWPDWKIPNFHLLQWWSSLTHSLIKTGDWQFCMYDNSHTTGILSSGNVLCSFPS